MLFRDRVDAGRQLAPRLIHLRGRDPVVVGLPRGGLPVAFEVANLLHAPLDVVVVRKLGTPYRPELAMGALGEGGVVVVNEGVVREAGVSSEEFATVRDAEQVELDRRVRRLRRGKVPVALAGRTVVIVDDGAATVATARAACQVVRAAGAARLILAVPVGASDTMASLRTVADEVVCLQLPEDFLAVGQSYADFAPVGDDEVVKLLERAHRRIAERPAQIDLSVRALDVIVSTADAALPGRLTVPGSAQLTVVFAHGSGSSRHSPRNAFVASVLHRAGLGTLLVDLLTPAEERDRVNVFDIPLLARRLGETAAWLRTAGLGPSRIAFFGASTGAAAALWASADPGADIAAVVSRGGRPDLAQARLGAVTAPTLLIVGSLDREVLDLNRAALGQLGGQAQLAVVPGATHLFEEPGALPAAADLARDWFLDHLTLALHM